MSQDASTKNINMSNDLGKNYRNTQRSAEMSLKVVTTSPALAFVDRLTLLSTARLACTTAPVFCKQRLSLVCVCGKLLGNKGFLSVAKADD